MNLSGHASTTTVNITTMAATSTALITSSRVGLSGLFIVSPLIEEPGLQWLELAPEQTKKLIEHIDEGCSVIRYVLPNALQHVSVLVEYQA